MGIDASVEMIRRDVVRSAVVPSTERVLSRIEDAIRATPVNETNFGKKKDKRDPNNYSFINERNNLVEILKPRNSIQQKTGEKKSEWEDDENYEPQISDEKLNDVLEQQFEYLSRTCALEINTQRTASLQKIVDLMLADSGIQARVVIMNKGILPNAFVFPEGTIFISQSALNALDSMDEVGAVLAHELNHLLYKTAERIYNAESPIESLSLGWVHEMAADLQTVQLMEKAKLNTRAFESAIQKIGDNSRDFVYQTGLSRSVEMAGRHYILDTSTSDLPLTPIETQLKTNQVIPTNKEIIDLIARNFEKKPANLNLLINNLKKLHGRDLESILTIIDRCGSDKADKVEKLVKAYRQEIRERLRSIGYSETDIKLFELALSTGKVTSDTYRDYDLNLINNDKELLDILPRLEEYDTGEKTLSMYHSLFETAVNPALRNPDSYSQFVNYLSELQIESEQQDRGSKGLKRISIGPDVWVQALGFLNNKISGMNYEKLRRLENTYLMYKSEYYGDQKDFIEMNIQRMFLNYPRWHYLKSALNGKQPLDRKAVQAYFQQAKDLGLPISWQQERNLSDEYRTADSVTKEYIEIIAAIYEIELKEPEKPKEVSFEDYLINEFGNKEHKHYMRAYYLHKAISKEANRLYGEDKQVQLKRVKELLAIIDTLDLETEDDPLEVLSGRQRYRKESRVDKRDYEEGKKIIKFTLKMMFLRTLYAEGDEAFFQTARELMETSGINIQKLTPSQLINLSEPVLVQDATNSYGGDSSFSSLFGNIRLHSLPMKEDKYENLVQLPFVQELRLKMAQLPLADNIAAFHDDLKLLTESISEYRKISDLLYGDSILDLIVGEPLRKHFQRILNQGIEVKDYATLYNLLKDCLPDSSKKTDFLKRLKLSYFKSANIPLEDKIAYLETNFNEIGPEGLLILGDEIHTFQEYEVFRKRMAGRLEEYLSSPGSELSTMSFADYASSFFIRNFKEVFKSASNDDIIKKEVSTALAKKWTEDNVRPRRSGYGYESSQFYSPEHDQFVVSAGYSRDTFNSYKDLIDKLHSLSSTKRYAIVMKLLTDSDGALSSEESREQLSKLVINALGVKPGFVSAALEASIKSGDHKLIGLFATRMMAPLIFRGIDAENVDTKKILAESSQVAALIPNSDRLQDILSSPAEELVFFGAHYMEAPNSTLSRLARESDQQYRQTLALLDSSITIETADGKKESQSEIDPALEAIISGIEGSSPMGVRSLQLARQLYRFSPAVEQRLAQSLDSNPGLRKLFIWENLTKWMGEDPGLAQFLHDRVLTIDSYLGGGSLCTTLGITIRGNDGQPQEAVIKILNPNARSIIEENYRASQDILTKLREQSNGKWEKEISTTELLIDLANSWCIADINDATFKTDDERFRDVIAGYKGTGRFLLFAPEVEFNSMKVKSELRVPGRTVNKILEDPSVPDERKQQIIRELAQFMLYQLNADTQSFEDESGKPYKIVHSDPHVGNYIIDDSTEQSRMGVIDRSMYLRMVQEDVTVIESLIKEHDNTKFLDLLLNRILDVNKVHNPIERTKIKGKIWMIVGKEFVSQKMGSTQESNFRLLQLALSSLPHGVTPPLNLLLMIKNVSAMGELLQKYGLSWNEIVTA